ncbi:MAG TPA: VWA domain-containing protein [Candidatus Polarisedimenticolaceae bacterium]|nr:VWA domain-containing protein [Candidatus Polarisedimenticolaceae bacterium]
MIPFLFALFLAAQDEPPPVETGIEEQVQVILLQVDVTVTDKNGRTVPDLKREDFTLKIAGQAVPIEALDVFCPTGPLDDPMPTRDEFAETPPPFTTGLGQKVVFAFDYTFLGVTMRPQVLAAAERMLRTAKAPDEEVMIVALAGEVRIEQRFTKDIRLLTMALDRMGRDVTLWARDFPIGVSGESYFQHVTTLMDVLESYDGPKAVVYFSQAGLVPSAMIDLWYRNLAAHAAASRSSIYPAKPGLLSSGGANETLVRFANETGGRMQQNTNDLSLPYRRAQRDMSCHYTIAVRVNPNERRDPAKLQIKVVRPDLLLRSPETVQVFRDADKRRSRAAAAYVDPGPYEKPLVRAFAFPAIPTAKGKWETLLAVSFPTRVRPEGTDVDVSAVIRREHRTVEEYKRKVHVDPPEGGGTTRPVSVIGKTKLGDGAHDLTVVLGERKANDVDAAQAAFVVPQVVPDTLMLRGPVLGKVARGGEVFRGRPNDRPDEKRLGKLLGPDNAFEPLLIQEVGSNDQLLFYWSACVVGTSPLPSDVIVKRRLLGASGEPVKELDMMPLNLEPRGKNVLCADSLETLTSGTLTPGNYKVDVAVVHPNGSIIARGTEPLTVR